MIQDDSMDWTEDIEKILEEIRINACSFYTYYSDKYNQSKMYLQFIKIPTIAASSICVFASVGLPPYIDQHYVSLTVFGLSFITTAINSIEMFIGIQKNMEQWITSSKDFYSLATDIFKVLSLEPQNRNVSGRQFLNEIYQLYSNLVEMSNLTDTHFKDELIPISLD